MHHDRLKNIFRNIFQKYFQKYFSQDFDSPILHEFRDLLYQIYGNIYLFFTRGEPRPFERVENQNQIEIRDLLYQIYGNIYLFFTRGEPRPFESVKIKIKSRFGTFCTESTVKIFSQEGNLDLLRKIFSKNIFEKYFWKFSRFRQPNFTSNFGTFCTKSTVTYIYFSQEGNHDLLKCQKIFWKYFSRFRKIFLYQIYEKYFSQKLFWNVKKYFENIFRKIIFSRFRQPHFNRDSGPFVPNLR